MTMPAGKYYVGDLCYVLHDSWDEFCDITIDSPRVLDGEFSFKDGRRFATFGTKWGDGQYHDQDGHRYNVDAGLIGCVRVDDIDMDLREQAGDFGGRIVTFDKPFDVWEENGMIRIGHLSIDTDPSYDDYEGDDDNALEEEF